MSEFKFHQAEPVDSLSVPQTQPPDTLGDLPLWTIGDPTQEEILRREQRAETAVG